MKTQSLISTIFLFILSALSSTWAEDVSLSIDSDIPEGSAGHFYINAPSTGKDTLNITEEDLRNGMDVFKIYDNGGKNGNIEECNSTLYIAFPNGYKTYVTGTSTTGSTNYAYLMLGNKQYGHPNGSKISYETGNFFSMTFYSKGHSKYSGFDLTIEIVKNNLLIDPNIEGGIAGHYYTIMPSKDYETRNIVISEEDLENGQGTFKIYGSSQWWSTLNLTAPEDYVFHVQGTMEGDDYSYVIFNDDNKIFGPGKNTQGYYITTEVGYVSPRNTLKVYNNGIDLEFEVQIKKIVFHGITVAKPDAGGTITVDKSTASQNETVTLTIEPEKGYYLKSLTVSSSDNESINVENFDWPSTSTSFAMPNKDVTVSAVFAELQTVSVNSSITGGTVTVDKVKAGATEPVTLTVTPETGYYLKSLTVLTTDEEPIEVEELDWITGVTSFLMPAKDVTINVTFGNKGAAYSGYYVNMKSDKTINLDFSNMPVNFSIKLYDDGGKNGWSSKYNQAAKITVPEDCKIKISATIYLGHKYEGLKIYNGLTDNSNNLILSETGPVTNKSIETLIPSNKGYIYFKEYSTSDKSNFDLTVTLINENAEYEIETQKASWGEGSIASDKSKAKVGETVTLTATPETGYVFDYATVKADNAETRIGNWWSGYKTTFTMPATDVTVTPSFRSASNSLSIDMPKSGTRVVNIQDGIKSFKINSVYYVESNSLDINVPEGHHLELLGKVTKLMDKAKLKIYGINYENNSWTCQNKENYDFSFSSTQSTVTIESYDMGNYYYDGDHPDQFEITVKVVNDNAKSKITVVQSELGGNVTLSPSETDATAAFTETELNNMAVGKNIFARITIPDGYVFDGLEVKDVDGNTISVSDRNNQLLEHGYWWESVIGSYPVKFTMPGTDVTVTPKFIKGTAEAGVSVDMPNNNTKDVYIPEGLKSINVYDDGGKDGNYRKNSKYALALHAPSGYHFRFSGSINTNTGAWLSINSGSCSAGFNDCCYKNPITDRLTSETYGKWSSIATVEGPQVTTLYFSSQDGTGELTNAAGLNLKAEIISDNMVMVSFDANGGSGSMDYIELEKGSKYTLPKCTFTAPEGKTTPRWQIGESYYEEGDVVTITASTVIKVAWRTAATLSVNQYSYWTYGESPRKPELKSYNGDATVTYEYYRYEDSNKIKTTPENSGANTEGGIPKKAGIYYVKAIAAKTDLYGPAEVEKQFTINPRALIINGLSAENKTYDGSATATTSGTAVLQGVINNDDVSVVVGSANFADPNVGTGKAVTFSGFTLSGADASNYELTKTSLPTDVTANITKAPLTITAKNKTITYGDGPANNGVEYTGFVGEEDVSVLGGTLDLGYNYEKGNATGEYTITPSGLTSDNYEINFVNGSLTVEAKKTSFAAVQIFEDESGKQAVFNGEYTSEGTVDIPEDIEVTSVEFGRAFTPDVFATVTFPFEVNTSCLTGVDSIIEFQGITANYEVDFGVIWKKNANPEDQTHTTLQPYQPYMISMNSATLGINCRDQEHTSLTLKATSDKATEGIVQRSGNWIFIGTLAYKQWQADDPDLTPKRVVYGYAAEADGKYGIGAFVRIGSNASISPFRAYIKYSPLPKSSAPYNKPVPDGVMTAKSARSIYSVDAGIDDLPESMDVAIVSRDENGNKHTTVIGSINTHTGEIRLNSRKADRWFDMQGRMLKGKPTMKGRYLHNGKVEIVK